MNVEVAAVSAHQKDAIVSYYFCIVERRGMNIAKGAGETKAVGKG